MERPTIADYPPGTRLPPRVIEDFEFVWMLSGQAAFLASEEMTLRPGQLLLVPPGVRHGFVWDERRPSRHGYVHFRDDDVGREVAPEIRLVPMSSADPLTGLCAHLLWIGRSDHEDWESWAHRTLQFMVTLVEFGPTAQYP